MKILFSEQVREADVYTINNLPISSIDLMEVAASQLFRWVLKHFTLENKIIFFCGPGNNGGDGLALARMLAEKQYHIEVFILKTNNGPGGDSLINYERLKKINKVPVEFIEVEKDLPYIQKKDVVIDALFGSGLTRPLQGFPVTIVEHMNFSGAEIISVDIPSGLFGEDNRNNNLDNVVQSDYTLSFQFPKLSFFFPASGSKVGEWEVLPIGLHTEYISSVIVKHYVITKEYLSGLIKRRNKFSHKGHFGHSLLLSGSYGMMGAAVLASRACIKTGTGLITTHIPRLGYEIMQISVPEGMVSIDQSDTRLSSIPEIDSFNAVGIGPGIGQKTDTAAAFEKLLATVKVPLVIDADGLNIIGNNKHLLDMLPENTILTPHPKEFERIAGKSTDDFSRNRLQQDFSKKYKLIVVLKGAYTAITDTGGSTYFNTSGNPGMATAGSGDVLTGMILALLSQGYNPINAAFLGVYLHGASGDIFIESNPEESLCAGDLINNIGAALKLLKQ